MVRRWGRIARFGARFMHNLVKNTPSRVENKEASRVGSIISVGLALPSDVRTAMMDVGRICKDVAFNTKKSADEYSASSVLSSKVTACTPYGVAAPEMPKRLTDKFIQTTCRVFSSSVWNIRFASGFKSLEIPCVTPLSSQTRIKPSHTA